jgi:hypothetical protein
LKKSHHLLIEINKSKAPDKIPESRRQPARLVGATNKTQANMLYSNKFCASLVPKRNMTNWGSIKN